MVKDHSKTEEYYRDYVFIENNKPYYIQKDWIYYWHPDKKWVAIKNIKGSDKLYPDNLTRYEQSLYFKNSEYKPDWYTEGIIEGDFCECGQVKHVGFDVCMDCLYSDN